MVRPVLQSGIDGLCGLHAVINAVRYLYPTAYPLWSPQLDDLAEALARTMSAEAFKTAWLDGVDRPEVITWLQAALAHLKRRHPTAAISVTTPFDPAPAPATRADVYWHCIDSMIGGETHNSSVAIIGLGDPDPHWSVVTGIAGHSVTLFDSSIYTRIRRAQTAIGQPKPGKWMIEPRDTIIIRRAA